MRVRGKRRYANSVVWVAAFVGCVVFAAAMMLGVLFSVRDTTAMRAQFENEYQKSFFEMADSVEQIELALSEMMVSVTDEQLIEKAGEVRRQAQLASLSLDELPVSVKTSFDVNKFFNQVDDWCASYSRSLLSGGETSDFEESFEEIFIATCNVNARIRDIATNFAGGNYRASRGLVGRGVRSGNEFVGDTDLLSDGEIEYPELIYDGAYSDRDGEKCFRALENLPLVTQEEAAEGLAEIFSSHSMTGLRCYAETTEPDAFEFVCTLDGGTAYLSVAKNGGKLLSLNTDSKSDSVSIERERAEALAIGYAEKCGYCCSFVPVSYQIADNVAYIELARKSGDVVFYPDLIKVKVGLGDGKLMAFEATGYCLSCCERDQKPLINEKTAKGAVSPKLTIHSSRLVVIPEGKTEKLCYELEASYKQMNYKVYVDAITAKQTKITRTDKA